jgi:hypothetical protein
MKIFVEGGGNQKVLLGECRKAFRELFEKAGVKKGSFEIIASGSRLDAYKDFKNALNAGHTDAILLVDSEEQVRIIASAANSRRLDFDRTRSPTAIGRSVRPWQHLRERVGDDWDQPAGATNRQVHFMVACMEAWFLADKDALAAYYRGPHRREQFNEATLPSRPDIEGLSKTEVMAALSRATRPNQSKKEYTDKSKGAHSFKILATLDPEKIARASYHAQRLFCHLGVRWQWLDCDKLLTYEPD